MRNIKFVFAHIIAILLGTYFPGPEVNAAPIGACSVVGPTWGRAGLGIEAMNFEGRHKPTPGDFEFDPGIFAQSYVSWTEGNCTGTVDFKTFPNVIKQRTVPGYEWAGMVEYMHTWVKIPTQATITITATSAPFPLTIWRDGTPVSTGTQFIWQAGWHTLMIKAPGPSNVGGKYWDQAWTANVDIGGLPVGSIFSAKDPYRRILATSDNQPFRFYSTLKRADDSTKPVFALGEPTDLSLIVKAGIGTAPNYLPPERRQEMFIGEPWVYSTDPALAEAVTEKVDASKWRDYLPVTARVTVIRDNGEVILNAEEFTLDWFEDQAQVDLDVYVSNKLGHFYVDVQYLDADGKVLIRDHNHAFSVNRGPVNKTKDSAPRIIGAVGHWLMLHKNPKQNILWLSRVGITKHTKMAETWSTWGISESGVSETAAVTVVPTAEMKEAIAYAQGLGIEITGDLYEGYLSPLAWETDRLRPNWWGRTFPALTALSKTVYFNYAYQMAKAYPSITRWTGANEIDLVVPLSKLPYSIDAARQIKAGLKAANPNATYVSASLSGERAAETNWLLSNGIAEADVVDMHTHPYSPPTSLSAESLHRETKHGRAKLLQYGVPVKAMTYGEISSPKGHNPRGAIGQAADAMKQIAWGIAHRESAVIPVQQLSYLVPYGDPYYEDTATSFNNNAGDPLQIVNAVNTMSHYMDGRAVLSAPTLPIGVEVLRVKDWDTRQPETLLIWSNTPQTIAFPVKQTWITRIDMYGRNKAMTVTNGIVSLVIDDKPIIVRGKF